MLFNPDPTLSWKEPDPFGAFTSTPDKQQQQLEEEEEEAPMIDDPFGAFSMPVLATRVDRSVLDPLGAFDKVLARLWLGLGLGLGSGSGSGSRS